jgi:molybdate transport system regulatory protein
MSKNDTSTLATATASAAATEAAGFAGDYTAVTKIFLSAPGGRGEPFCGPGMIKLLCGIKETRNVRKTCELMEMSYSKGWKLLRLLDDCLKCKIVARQQGGKGGGEAHLTEEGEAFLKKFLAFEDAATKAVDRLFDKYFPKNTKR